jgi:hypothetical protein
MGKEVARGSKVCDAAAMAKALVASAGHGLPGEIGRRAMQYS